MRGVRQLRRSAWEALYGIGMAVSAASMKTFYGILTALPLPFVIVMTTCYEVLMERRGREKISLFARS